MEIANMINWDGDCKEIIRIERSDELRKTTCTEDKPTGIKLQRRAEKPNLISINMMTVNKVWMKSWQGLTLRRRLVGAISRAVHDFVPSRASCFL